MATRCDAVMVATGLLRHPAAFAQGTPTVAAAATVGSTESRGVVPECKSAAQGSGDDTTEQYQQCEQEHIEPTVVSSNAQGCNFALEYLDWCRVHRVHDLGCLRRHLLEFCPGLWSGDSDTDLFQLLNHPAMLQRRAFVQLVLLHMRRHNFPVDFLAVSGERIRLPIARVPILPTAKLIRQLNFVGSKKVQKKLRALLSACEDGSDSTRV